LPWPKKRLTAQEKLQLVIESLKGDVKAPELCRKTDIWPTQLNRLKQRALEGALRALNSRKGRGDPEKEELESRIERLKEIIIAQASEITLIN
jgi:transposase-like protein